MSVRFLTLSVMALVGAIFLSSEGIASGAQQLAQYLAKPVIPDQVRKIALEGIKTYKKGLFKKERENLGPRGGRGEGWIKQTFGMEETDILRLFKDLPGPKTWSLGDIDTLYTQLKSKFRPSQKSLPFIIVTGVSANYLHDSPLGKDSILQVASQFNYLESMNTEIAPVAGYILDMTQGPQASIEAAAAAIHRLAAAQGTPPNLLHALNKVIPDWNRALGVENEATYYKNGYLVFSRVPEEKLERILHYMEIKKNLDKLEILPQWVICEASGALQLQVFSAAPSYQGSSSPTGNGAALCELLVAAQYEAIAKIAVIRSILTKKLVRLHLTLVGQGAFNNPPSVMEKAFDAVDKVVKGYNVQVYIHAFNPITDVKKVPSKYDVNIMEKEAFMTPKKTVTQRFKRAMTPTRKQAVKA